MPIPLCVTCARSCKMNSGYTDGQTAPLILKCPNYKRSCGIVETDPNTPDGWSGNQARETYPNKNLIPCPTMELPSNIFIPNDFGLVQPLSIWTYKDGDSAPIVYPPAAPPGVYGLFAYTTRNGRFVYSPFWDVTGAPAVYVGRIEGTSPGHLDRYLQVINGAPTDIYRVVISEIGNGKHAVMIKDDAINRIRFSIIDFDIGLETPITTLDPSPFGIMAPGTISKPMGLDSNGDAWFSMIMEGPPGVYSVLFVIVAADGSGAMFPSWGGNIPLPAVLPTITACFSPVTGNISLVVNDPVMGQIELFDINPVSGAHASAIYANFFESFVTEARYHELGQKLYVSGVTILNGPPSHAKLFEFDTSAPFPPPPPPIIRRSVDVGKDATYQIVHGVDDKYYVTTSYIWAPPSNHIEEIPQIPGPGDLTLPTATILTWALFGAGRCWWAALPPPPGP